MKLLSFLLSITLSVTQSVDSIVNHSIQSGEIPGAVVCYVESDTIAFIKAYGNRAIIPTVEAMTTKTVFDLASVSKPVGAGTAVVELAKEGKIDVDKMVREYLPNFQGDATIRHLMNHTSGLIPYFNAYFLDSIYQADKDKKNYTSSQAYLVDSICRSKRLNKPGEKVRYSCLNFITLQQIVETITGKSLATICPYYRPIEMQPEQFTTPLEQIAPTEKLKDGTIIRGQVHDPMARILMKGVSGNAGVFMNAEQLAEWCIYFMSIPAQQREAGCNAGLWKGENNSLSHSGYTGTYVRLYPDTHDAIIILANRVHPEDKGDLNDLRESIIEAFRK